MAVESAGVFDSTEFGEYVVTDENGCFRARAKLDYIVIRAWKPGYALGAALFRNGGRAAAMGDTTISLRRVVAANAVTKRSTVGVAAIGKGCGFSVSKGIVVEPASGEADFIIESGPSGGLMLQACGYGGVVNVPIQDCDWLEIEFYNTPLAPLDGYVRECELPSGFDECLFVFLRTKEGGHYAKVRFFRNVVPIVDGSTATFDIVYAYQPDGTMELEVECDGKLPFPLEKFGIRRTELGSE